jgi:hypothetical protein
MVPRCDSATRRRPLGNGHNDRPAIAAPSWGIGHRQLFEAAVGGRHSGAVEAGGRLAQRMMVVVDRQCSGSGGPLRGGGGIRLGGDPHP